MVAVQNAKQIKRGTQADEFADYPDDVVRRWTKEAEIADLQIATGELVPMSTAEIAAAVGCMRYING